MIQSTLDFLKRLIWLNEESDDHFIFNLTRITGARGAQRVLRIATNNYSLPTPNGRYHVYNIGKIDASDLGLQSPPNYWRKEKWFTTQDTNADDNDILTFTDEGDIIPSSSVFHMLANNGNLLVAVNANSKGGFLLHTKNLSIKFYSNAFFNKEGNESKKFDVVTKTIVDTVPDPDLLIPAVELPYTYFRINGMFSDNVSHVVEGDLVDKVVDESIKLIHHVPIGALRQFSSNENNVFKVTVAYPSELGRIDHNDIDIYITHLGEQGRKGLYYPVNTKESITSLTSSHVAIEVNEVYRIARNLQDKINVNISIADLYITTVIRESNKDTVLIKESSHLSTLFTLPDYRIKQLISGFLSTPVWYGENLEAARYAKSTDTKLKDMSNEMVLDALGYYGVVDQIGTQVLPSSTDPVLLPTVYRSECSVINLDPDGKFVSFQGFVNTESVTPAAGIDRFMVIPGIVSPNNIILHPHNTINTQEDISYYAVVEGEYVDIVEGGYYDLETHSWIPQGNTPLEPEIFEASTNSCYYKTTNISDADLETNGIIFKITDDNDGDLNILRENILVFLNNVPMVPLIDFNLDGDMIYIYNTDALKADGFGGQDVRIIMYGLLKRSYQITIAQEVGFLTEYGKRVPMNDDYHPLESIPYTVIEGQGLKDIDNSLFRLAADDDLLNTSTVASKPYAVQAMNAPLRATIGEDYREFKNRSIAKSKEVIEFMVEEKQYHIELYASDISSTPYEVVSPFIKKITRLTMLDPETEFIDNGMDLLEYVEPFLHYLNNDPITLITGKPKEFVKILPHLYTTPVTLPQGKFNFIEMIIRLYADGLIDINEYFIES